MDEFPNELIEHLMYFIKNKKVIRLINRRFKAIIDRIIFHTPSWKVRPHIDAISHLPIRILKISQIHHGNFPINRVHLALTHFILDSDLPEIAPSVVSDHPETMFFISVKYLFRCSYDKSNFIRSNVKLFTNDSRIGGMNWKTLALYKDFTFSTLSISHIECGEMPDILELLSGFKIERLILDRFGSTYQTFHRPLEPIELIKFQNIIHFSSQIFKKGDAFPLFLVNKLTNLETFHCRRKTVLNFSEFARLQKKSVSIPALHYWDHVTVSNFSIDEYTLSRIFQNCKNDDVYCRHSILIHLTKDPPKHLQFLQNTSL